MENVKRVKLENFLRKEGSKIFTVFFVKKNGEDRMMNCRFGVKKHLKGTGNASSVEGMDKPYLCVFDMQKQQYRSINLETIYKINIGGKEMEVV